MAAEPSEEAIENFVSFTSTTREQAISFLKANDNNSNKAINAYFEDPTGPQTQSSGFDNDQQMSSFQVEHADPVPTSGQHATAPPSRPPSRINMNELPMNEYQLPAPSASNTGQGMTLSEREEQELQQAVAMSLNQNLGQQETGVTTTQGGKFGEATRDHYDEGNWAMTLFNPTSREIVISPDPEDRRRVNNEPAFLRPSPDNQYLGGLITILHSIPLAREALLFRNRMLPDYGHDPQWWNGQPISLPKIVTMQDVQDGDTNWDDILYEAQRLMAFLDSTNRSFGSSDALASLKSMTSYSEGSVGKFLETWHGSAARADPGNESVSVFSSNAYKRPLSVYDTPIHKEFFSLDPFVEPEHGQTLYDVLDRAMWSDRPGDELDDVWLENIAEVLTIRLESSADSVDVKIPAVFYPDRYLTGAREFAREFRSERLRTYEEIYKTERLMNQFSMSKSLIHKGLGSKETLEKAAVAASQFLSKGLASGASDASVMPETASTEAQRLAEELKSISNKIVNKLQELESRKNGAIETLRGYSKLLTEPSASPDEPPHHKYTLRGVCTQPHITYVLRPRENAQESDARTDDEWQWWRISFSTEDAKTQQAESDRGKHAAPSNTDVIGYTARRVREIEVLRAAREESRSALLIYASVNAVTAQEDQIQAPLQRFLDADNQAFEAELQEAKVTQQPVLNDAPAQAQGVTSSQDAGRSTVNVFDYQVASFDNEADPVGPEMQEKGRGLLSQSHGFTVPSTSGPGGLGSNDADGSEAE